METLGAENGFKAELRGGARAIFLKENIDVGRAGENAKFKIVLSIMKAGNRNSGYVYVLWPGVEWKGFDNQHWPA